MRVLLPSTLEKAMMMTIFCCLFFYADICRPTPMQPPIPPDTYINMHRVWLQPLHIILDHLFMSVTQARSTITKVWNTPCHKFAWFQPRIRGTLHPPGCWTPNEIHLWLRLSGTQDWSIWMGWNVMIISVFGFPLKQDILCGPINISH